MKLIRADAYGAPAGRGQECCLHSLSRPGKGAETEAAVSLLLTTWTITAPAPDLPSHREEGRGFGFVLVARKIKLGFLIVSSHWFFGFLPCEWRLSSAKLFSCLDWNFQFATTSAMVLVAGIKICWLCHWRQSEAQRVTPGVCSRFFSARLFYCAVSSISVFVRSLHCLMMRCFIPLCAAQRAADTVISSFLYHRHKRREVRWKGQNTTKPSANRARWLLFHFFQTLHIIKHYLYAHSVEVYLTCTLTDLFGPGPF